MHLTLHELYSVYLYLLQQITSVVCVLYCFICSKDFLSLFIYFLFTVFQKVNYLRNSNARKYLTSLGHIFKSAFTYLLYFLLLSL